MEMSTSAGMPVWTRGTVHSRSVANASNHFFVSADVAGVASPTPMHSSRVLSVTAYNICPCCLGTNVTQGLRSVVTILK